MRYNERDVRRVSHRNAYVIADDAAVKFLRGEFMYDKTMTFTVPDDKELEMHRILTEVYDALKQKGYNPISQIVGYILSEDPTYITTHNNARSLIRKIDRDELLQAMVKSYLAD